MFKLFIYLILQYNVLYYSIQLQKYVRSVRLTDWCLMPTLAIFQLYHGVDQFKDDEAQHVLFIWKILHGFFNFTPLSFRDASIVQRALHEGLYWYRF